MRSVQLFALLFVAFGARASEDVQILQSWDPDVPQKIRIEAKGGFLNDLDVNASNLANSVSYAPDGGPVAIAQKIGRDQEQSVAVELAAEDGIGAFGNLQNAANLAALSGRRRGSAVIDQGEVGDGFRQEVRASLSASSPTGRFLGPGEERRLSGGNLVNSATYAPEGSGHGRVSFALDQDLSGAEGLRQEVEVSAVAGDGGEGDVGLSFQNSLNTLTGRLERQDGSFAVVQDAGRGTVQDIRLRADVDADRAEPAGEGPRLSLSAQNIANFVNVTATTEVRR